MFKIKPIFEEFTADKQLVKCLHGKTQNANESFNATIWERVSKSYYVSLTQLKFGVFDAVANFNIGRKASILIFEILNMVPGKYTLQGCETLNQKRLFRAAYKNSDINKLRRKTLRGQKMEKSDKTMYMKQVDFKKVYHSI